MTYICSVMPYLTLIHFKDNTSTTCIYFCELRFLKLADKNNNQNDNSIKVLCKSNVTKCNQPIAIHKFHPQRGKKEKEIILMFFECLGLITRKTVSNLILSFLERKKLWHCDVIFVLLQCVIKTLIYYTSNQCKSQKSFADIQYFWR